MKSCIDCPKRYVGCHSHCKDYREYKSRLEKAKEGREGYFEYSGYMAECLWKHKRI